jgi:hypothetical protein
MELKQAKKEVIYKFGRNVLMFRQMEHLLKHLVANDGVSGHPRDFTAKTKKRVDSVMKKTLGMVAGEYLDPPEAQPPPEQLKEPHFTVSPLLGLHCNVWFVLFSAKPQTSKSPP